MSRLDRARGTKTIGYKFVKHIMVNANSWLSKVDKRLDRVTVFMPRRRIPENVQWQITGMNGAGMSCRNIGVHLDINHTVISRLEEAR